MVMLACGVVCGIVHPATDLALLAGVDARRQGFAFGVKQAGSPAASLLAGLLLPVVAQAVGWRWVFVFAGGLAAVAWCCAPDVSVPVRRAPTEAGHEERRLPGLRALGIGSALALGSATALAAFFVPSVVAAGNSLDHAAALFVAASSLAIAVRLVAGLIADRIGRGHGEWAAAMLALAACGFLGLSLGGPWATVGAVVAYACAWGWTGLVLFAVSTAYRHTSARATGLIHMGASTGAAVGPLAVGAALRVSSVSVAWIVVAAAAASAACLLVVGARRVDAQRGPTTGEEPG